MKKFWNSLSWGQQTASMAWCGGIAFMLASLLETADIEKITIVLIGGIICASSVTYFIGYEHGRKNK